MFKNYFSLSKKELGGATTPESHSLHPLEHVILMTDLRTNFVSNIFFKLPLFVFNWLLWWASELLNKACLRWALEFYRMNF